MNTPWYLLDLMIIAANTILIVRRITVGTIAAMVTAGEHDEDDDGDGGGDGGGGGGDDPTAYPKQHERTKDLINN